MVANGLLCAAYGCSNKATRTVNNGTRDVSYCGVHSKIREMEFNAKQVEEWRRKAKAYDMGQEAWVVFNTHGDPVSCGYSEYLAHENLVSSETYLGPIAVGYRWSKREEIGYTCRRVRVCEEVEEL